MRNRIEVLKGRLIGLEVDTSDISRYRQRAEKLREHANQLLVQADLLDQKAIQLGDADSVEKQTNVIHREISALYRILNMTGDIAGMFLQCPPSRAIRLYYAFTEGREHEVEQILLENVLK